MAKHSVQQLNQKAAARQTKANQQQERTIVEKARDVLQVLLGRVFPESKWIFIPRTKDESNAENSLCAATGFEFEKLLPVLEKARWIRRAYSPEPPGCRHVQSLEEGTPRLG